MKKLLLLAAVAMGCIGMNAQEKLTLSTYKGTDLAKYANKTLTVTVSRYLFNGWNTISLPFAMSQEQVNETFGNDCRLERLTGIENDGTDIKLNFQNCKSEGIKANVPYILYYTGLTGTKNFTTENATVSNTPAALTFTAEGTGETVTMAAAKQQKDAAGLYGILAKDNAEAAFVNVDNVSNGFYATRCYIQLSNGNSTLLTTNHIVEEASSISAVVKAGEQVDVYNISGRRVASGINAAELSRLQKGIYVVKGKKVLVK